MKSFGKKQVRPAKMMTSWCVFFWWLSSLARVDQGEAWPSRHPALQAAPSAQIPERSQLQLSGCHATLRDGCRWRSGRRRSLPAPELLAASTGHHGCTPTSPIYSCLLPLLRLRRPGRRRLLPLPTSSTPTVEEEFGDQF